MMNKLFGIPKINMGIVDVRDVAKAHIIALTNPLTNGKRYIVDSNNNLWMKEVCDILRE